MVSGTPTAAGTETFTLTATDSLGATAATITVLRSIRRPGLTPATLPDAAVSAAYDQTITANGGTGDSRSL